MSAARTDIASNTNDAAMNTAKQSIAPAMSLTRSMAIGSSRML